VLPRRAGAAMKLAAQIGLAIIAAGVVVFLAGVILLAG
jgi:hypothetical protein